MVKGVETEKSEDIQVSASVREPVVVVRDASSHPKEPSQKNLPIEVNSGTPPPSREPSPPPSLPPPVPKSDQGSNWTIEIEELSDEPPPARQSAKDKVASRSEIRDRRRSSSWSRSFMNSFRRKKSNELSSEVATTQPEKQDSKPTVPPTATKGKNKRPIIKSTSAVDHETDESEVEVTSIHSMEEEPEPEPVQDVTVLAAETKSNASSSQTKRRLSRILSFGSFGRRKSMPPISIDDHIVSKDDDHHNPSVNQETKQSSRADLKATKRRESKSEAKEKVNTKGSKAERDERLELQPSEAKSKLKKTKSLDKTTKERPTKEISTNDEAIETDPAPTDPTANDQSSTGKETNKTQSLERRKSRQKFFTLKAFSKSVDQAKPTDLDEEVEPPESQVIKRDVPAGVKPKRKAFSAFFKREKTSKDTAPVSVEDSFDAESPALSEVANLKKSGSRLRHSFGRRAKVKSTEVDTNNTAEQEIIRPVPVERNKKPRRSTSMVFGSSFSLKKMLGTEPQTAESTAEPLPVGKISPIGTVTKRPKGKLVSSTPRSKSFQLEEKQIDIVHDTPNSHISLSGLEIQPSRHTSIGERFVSFTRDSWRLKKKHRSVSMDDHNVTIDHSKEESKDIKEEDPEDNASQMVGQNEAHDHHPVTSSDVQSVANTNSTETEPKGEMKTMTVLPSSLHVDCEPEHVVVAPPSSTSRETQSTDETRAVPANTDLASLQELVENPVTGPSHKVKVPISPAYLLSDVLLIEALGDILAQLKSSSSSEGIQLRQILENPHLKGLLRTHDTVIDHLKSAKSDITGEFLEVDCDPYSSFDWKMPSDISAVRVVGIRKNPGEPLGLTVKTEEGQLVIARILAGGAVDRQGLLHVGDVIGEVNGVTVRSAEQLQVEIARCREHIQLKILPSMQENGSNGAQVGQSPSTILASETLNSVSVCCVRAHFDYDPKEDKLLPCPEIGLAFKKGDILQVVNQSDPNWWQAKKVGWSGPAGLIPSQELEERRKAFVAPEADFVHKIGFCGTRISKKKKKLMYQIKSSVDLDKAELLLYEEVTRMPPFRRKTLVLVGSEGIGRRTLKNRLINSDPDRFGTTMPHTSRPMRELEEDGMGYWFVSREEMEHDVRDHQFLEFGEHNSHLYGTKLDSIRAVIRQGKMCVLDCSPNALKTLHNSPEFMPYVIFLAAPGMEQLKSLYENSRYSSRNLGTFDRSSSIRFSSRRARTLESLTSLYEEEDFKNALEESARIQRIYEKYFDQIIVNEDPDQTFRKVVEALEILSNQHQWVPVSWVY